MEILVSWAVTSLLLILLMILIESLIIPRLRDSAKFKIWWRNNVIGDFDESA